MRKSRSLVLTMVSLLALSAAAQAQESPKEILERAYTAQGGFEKLAKFKATQVKTKGTIYLQDDGKVIEVPFTSEGAAQLPDKYKSTIQFEINGMKVVQAQTLLGDKATMLFNGNAQELDDNMSKEIKEQVYIEHVTNLLPLRESSYSLTAVPEIAIDGKPSVGIKVASKGHRDVTVYFDKKTGLVTRADYQAYDPIAKKMVAQEQLYREYKEQDGVKIPMKSFVTQDGKKFMDIEITEYKGLDKLDDSAFKP